jgi:hypothetical protein
MMNEINVQVQLCPVRCQTGITFSTIPTYYSDHMLLSFAIPKWNLLPVTKAGIPQGKADTSLSMSFKNLFLSVFGLL